MSFDVVDEVEEAAPPVFRSHVLGIDGEPDKDGLAHHMVFGNESPVA